MEEKAESKIERGKRAGNFLRGSIAQTLGSDATRFTDDDVQLLKFHGLYQQDDRDTRRARRAEGLEKAYSFMVRCAIPAGVVTPDQFLALDALADRHGNGSFRITSRQGIQLHGILIGDLKATLASINQTLLTTLSACGDVNRNVMACPAPLADETHEALKAEATRIAEALRPASRAYHEIWLDGEKQLSTKPEEPFYGDRYLPRKFKVGLVPAGHNCIDVYSYDLGLVAFIERGAVVGYNVLVGGGLGMTHSKEDTFAKLAEPLGYVLAEHAVETAKTIAAIFRDHGNRADRRHARLKYLIAEWGIDRFREEFRRRAAFELTSFQPMPPSTVHDHLGEHPQGAGRSFYGVYVENGRVVDTPEQRIKTALKQIVLEHRPGIAFTPDQNLLLTGLDESSFASIEKTLRDCGVTLPSELSAARRHSIACPALPTCGLALAESERVMPSLLDRIERELAALQLDATPLTIRMTGCPNACSRPYTADIAFVGRKPGVYHLYVGGGLAGDRLADLYAADVAIEDIVATLRPLLVRWAEQRREAEPLGDFYQRTEGRGEPRAILTGKETAVVQPIPVKGEA